MVGVRAPAGLPKGQQGAARLIRQRSGEAMPQPISVLIVDHQLMFSEAVGAALADQPDLEVVAQASTGPAAIAACEVGCPDVVLMDLQLPEMEGFTTTTKLLRRCPDVRVVVVSGSEGEEDIATAVELGAVGFISKERPLVELGEAIRRATRGELVLPEASLQALTRASRRRREERGATEPLSGREVEVLAALATGKSTRDIAADLHISEHTARDHVQHILMKLGARSQLEAVVMGVRRGLVEVG